MNKESMMDHRDDQDVDGEDGDREKIEFDMRNQDELNRWMSQTIQYASIGGGRDEIEESEVIGTVQDIIDKLPSGSLHMRDVAGAVLERAGELVGSEERPLSEVIEPHYLVNVMQWVLRSVAVVFIALGKSHNHDLLVVVTEGEIVGGVQGNKSRPRRDDLDKLVRKTIMWGLDKLGKTTVGV